MDEDDRNQQVENPQDPDTQTTAGGHSETDASGPQGTVIIDPEWTQPIGTFTVGKDPKWVNPVDEWQSKLPHPPDDPLPPPQSWDDFAPPNPVPPRTPPGFLDHLDTSDVDPTTSLADELGLCRPHLIQGLWMRSWTVLVAHSPFRNHRCPTRLRRASCTLIQKMAWARALALWRCL